MSDFLANKNSEKIPPEQDIDGSHIVEIFDGNSYALRNILTET
ncbi:hypothetical protein CSC33_0792 [Pseudomonas aeruginosa]|nr:hypothetical protein CSC33_0792 [Pseudomonas aeruginosa]